MLGLTIKSILETIDLISNNIRKGFFVDKGRGGCSASRKVRTIRGDEI
jgi:hypothetical protein